MAREQGPNIPTTVLDEAAHLTSKIRQQAYGHPRRNFDCIAEFWNTYLERRGSGEGFRLEPKDVGMMMLLVKIARYAHHPARDNLVDIAGYARTIEMLDEKE